MTVTDLRDHQVLVKTRRLRHTAAGWMEIVEEKAERPDPINTWDDGWPATSKRPYVCYGRSVHDVYHQLVGLEEPSPPAWWDSGWPQRFGPGRNTAVWLQMELGKRVTAELLRLAMPAPLKEAA